MLHFDSLFQLLYCKENLLENIEILKNFDDLFLLNCKNNNILSLKGIENLSKLTDIDIADNPISHKYKDLRGQRIVERVKLESCLEDGNGRIGRALVDKVLCEADASDLRFYSFSNTR